MQRIPKHLLRCRIVGAGGKVVLEALVGIEFVGVIPALEYCRQLHALGEGGQLVVRAVQQA